MVIEPAKNEYRALIQSIPEIQIFTPGKNFISPFVFNPFVPPENVRLETYKSTLKTAFAAAVSMTTPLDKILKRQLIIVIRILDGWIIILQLTKVRYLI